MQFISYLKKGIIRLISATIVLALAFPLYARKGEDYAANSILAEGRWIKISTTEAGIYQIPFDTLVSWGFTDPANVKLFGYGGLVIDELFSNDDAYIDDLPQIPLFQYDNKLYFYSTGTTKWEYSTSNSEFTHRLHPYSTRAYYFLTDKEVTPAIFPTVNNAPPTTGNTPLSVFDDYTVHEKELVNVGKTGQNFFGENFLAEASQNFSFHLPGAQPEPMKIRVSFGAKITDTDGYVYISYNNTELPTNTSNRITKYYDTHEFLRQATPLKTVSAATENPVIGIRYSSSGNTLAAYLDYIRLNYKRKLQLYDGQVKFRFINRKEGEYYQISNSSASTLVWDITVPHSPKNITTTFGNNTTSFVPEDTQLREFIAFDLNHDFPSPVFVREIANQNLHALASPDLTIITPAALQSEAERLAQLHTSEGLTVEVIEQEKIFNEFSSGTPDASAYRRLMKMFYDRTDGKLPKYLLLFGDGSYNNRQSMEKLHSPECNTLLTYQSKTSIDERESFVLEDYFGFLADESGEDIKTDKVCLGIGRIPVSSLTNARLIVDKLYRYAQNTDFSPWKNNICIAADDGDETIHTEQANKGCDTLLLQNTPTPRLGFRVNKIFVDSYYLDPATSQCPEANRELMKQFEEGMLIFGYIGHNDPEVGFTGEGLFSRYEMDNLSNRRLPLFITITCDYCRFDSEDLSAGENVFLNPTAGAIGLITTTRVVYTDGNDKINRRLMKRIFDRNPDGSVLRIGDMLKLAKQDFGTEIDKNKLNYILIGDPALKLTYPENNIQVTRIAGKSSDTEVELTAGKGIVVEGDILSYAGEPLTDFNGEIFFSLYDEEQTFTTLAHQDKKTYTYKYRPTLLTTGKGAVKNGKFTATVILPVENSHSGKSGLLNLYAYDETGREANGYTDKLIIGTSYEIESTDTQGPNINFAGLNDYSFTDGATIENPATFICQLSDPSGIWTANGIGKQMTLFLDGREIETNVTRYYTHSAENNIPSGTFSYPLPLLSNGPHTITFKVFDSLGNSSEVTRGFEIAGTGEFYFLSVDEEPVTECATLSCLNLDGNPIAGANRSRLAITNSLGEEVYARESTGNNLFPFTWDLLNTNGERVPAGVYYGQVYFETAAGIIATPAKKIVVVTQ